MMRTNVVLLGFGNVGRAFVRLLAEKRSGLQKAHDLDLSLMAVLRAGGGIMSIAPGAAFEPAVLVQDELEKHPSFRPGLKAEAVLEGLEPGILVECISAHPETGQPALGYLQAALTRGWHVVTASKGPLVCCARALRAEARSRGVAFKFSAATGAALPASDVGLMCLAGAEITCLQGILNGTSNFILTRMGEGLSAEEALDEARRLGIAEPDPSRDVSGRDSAAKLLILSNLLFDEDRPLQAVSVRGLSNVSDEDARRAARHGQKIKLVAEAQRAAGRTSLSVEPRPLDLRHPLFSVDGAEKGIMFVTDSMGIVTVVGGKSDPRGAAAAMLKDILLIPRASENRGSGKGGGGECRP